MPDNKVASSYAKTVFLSVIMILMTQVGYLDLMNAWSGDEETLDSNDAVA